MRVVAQMKDKSVVRFDFTVEGGGAMWAPQDIVAFAKEQLPDAVRVMVVIK